MAFQGNLLSKTLVIGIIFLFIGISAFPTVSDSIRNNIGISLITIQVTGEMGLNDWYVSDVGFIFTNESDNIAEIKYHIDYGKWQTYAEPFYISDDGEDICLIWFAVDYGENQSEVDGPFFCNIDQTPPEVELSYEVIGGNEQDGWDFLFTMNATDAMSGMDRVEFYLNNVLQETVSGSGPVYQWEFKYCKDLNNHIIVAIAFDKAGNFDGKKIQGPSKKIDILDSSQINENISEESSIISCLDDVFLSEIFKSKNDRIIAKSSSDASSRGVFDPAYVIVVFNKKTGENGWIVSNVSIPIFYESDRIDKLYYQINDGGWVLYNEALIFSDGIYVFSWYAVDSEGYTSTPDYLFFKVDRTPPEIRLKKERLAINKVKVIANVYDETSGIDRVEFIEGFHYPDFIDYDFPFEWIWTGYFSKRVKVRVYDNAGNSNQSSMTIRSCSHSYRQQSSNYLFLRLIDRFPFLEVFLRAMNLLR